MSEVSEMEAPVMPMMEPPAFPQTLTAPDQSNGNKAFGTLVNEMCRIYCDACSGQKQPSNFKKAAKQLLEDLFEEDSGLETAANQYLDNDFIHSIQSCE